MRIICEGTIGKSSVSARDLDLAFASDVERGDFIILERDDGGFIQAAGEGDGPYVIEYKEPDSEQLFQAKWSCDKGSILAAFHSYLKADDAWKRRFEWEPLDFDSEDEQEDAGPTIPTGTMECDGFPMLTRMDHWSQPEHFPVAEQERLRQILESHGIRSILKRLGMLEGEIYPPVIHMYNHVKEGTPLHRAHGNWTEGYIGKIASLDGLPRQEEGQLTPSGIVLVGIDIMVVGHGTGAASMGSHYGYSGFYVSILVSMTEGRIWDTRYEAAS